jgi:hypothetical protein
VRMKSAIRPFCNTVPRSIVFGRRQFPLAAIVLLITGGCSVWADPDRVQCSTNDDCSQRGGEFANTICTANRCELPGPWSCLNHVTWPAGGATNPTVTALMVDLITSQPVAGLTAKVCHKLDTACESPLRADLVSDSAGRMTLSVPSGFDGYLESTSADIMPFLYFFYPPVTADREVPAVPILRAAAMSTFANLVGSELMADRGHFLARVYNCLGQTAEGVSLSSPEGDSTTLPFYMIKGIPSAKVSTTDSSGNGGLLNLRPGTATLMGKLDNGDSTGLLSATIRPGRITYTAMVPAPR